MTKLGPVSDIVKNWKSRRSEVLGIECFVEAELDHDPYFISLSNTCYYYDIITSTWSVLKVPSKDGAYCERAKVTFQEVLDSLPAEMQTQLLFHLDLFR